jgi:hypothetical protein
LLKVQQAVFQLYSGHERLIYCKISFDLLHCTKKYDKVMIYFDITSQDLGIFVYIVTYVYLYLSLHYTRISAVAF